MKQEKGIWASRRTTDSYAWVTYLKDTGLPQLLRYEDQVNSMPFGHHQLCIFIEGDYE